MRTPLLQTSSIIGIAGASVFALSLSNSLASEPVVREVLVAPAPPAVLVDINSPEAAPRGGDILLQNDSVTDGSNAILQFGFANGEIGAARYNIDPGLFPIKIKKVQIFWQSALANGQQSLQDAINIYDQNFNLLANLEGPVMIDGGLNEFDLAPLNFIINTPTQLTVGLQFFDAPNGDALKGTMATDDNGCQTGLNQIFIPSIGWLEFCGLGISGDVVVRTIIEPMGGGTPCPADVNGDGMINSSDLGLLIAVFGEAPPSLPAADINGDGVANSSDLGLLIAAFGTACP